MEKIYKATMRALGARPNGSDASSCVDNAALVKQLLMLLSLAFSLGALTFGYKGLPQRVGSVEQRVIKIEANMAVLESVDRRLERIESVLMSDHYEPNKNNRTSLSYRR